MPLHRVLVTGATGFIGNRIVLTLLKEGISVKCLVRNLNNIPHDWRDQGVECCQGDLVDEASLVAACAGVDTVIHAAGDAHAWQEPCDTHTARQWKINAQGTFLLIQAAVRNGVKRFVFISSVAAGGESDGDCVDDDWQGEPTTAYGSAKLEAEHYVLEIGRQTGMHVCNLRPPLVYGPGLKGNLARMLEAVERGLFPPLPETGNRRSMIHVDDLARATLLAATQQDANSKTLVVTDGNQYSTRQIYEWMCRSLGRSLPRYTIPLWLLRLLARIGDLLGRLLRRRFIFDSEAMNKLTGSACHRGDEAVQVLGFRPRHDLETELPVIIEEYQRSLDA